MKRNKPEQCPNSKCTATVRRTGRGYVNLDDTLHTCETEH